MVISVKKYIYPGAYGKNPPPELLLLSAREGDAVCTEIYEKELYAYSLVAAGDVENVSAVFAELLTEKLARGGIEAEKLDEMKYRAAEIISIAARYAAEVTPRESECLEIADRCISEADKAQTCEGVSRILFMYVVRLTEIVRAGLDGGGYPYPVRKALAYIGENLSQSLTVREVARACGFSPDYLSAVFRRSTGVKMTAYIRRQRLLLSKRLLCEDMLCGDASRHLSFCSESYFVKCFRDEFGITPKKWQEVCSGV